MKRLLAWALVASTLALAAPFTGCSESTAPEAPAEETPTSQLDSRMLAETWQSESLDPMLEERMLRSPITEKLVAAGRTLAADGRFSIYPAEPAPYCYDVALVPLAGEKVTSFYLYSYEATTGLEAGRLLQVIPRGEKTLLRLFTEVDGDAYLEVVLDAEGRYVDVHAPRGKWGVDWEGCVVPKVITLINLGQATGLSEACITACLAGGAANPTCLGCVIGAAGALAFIVWDCWTW